MRWFLVFVMAVVLVPLMAQVEDKEPIIIGEMASYTELASLAIPHRQGWQMALEEINDSGGVLGRPLKIVSRDDKNDPAEGVKVAEELINSYDTVFIFGTILDHVAQAVSNVAEHNEIGFMKPGGGSSHLIWQNWHPYVFRLDASTDALARIFAADVAKLPAKRWAAIAPNYEYGRAMVADFKKHLLALRPDIEWVGEQWPALRKIQAGAEVTAMVRKEPEAILVVLFGKDLAAFLRENRRRGVLQDMPVVSPYLGFPNNTRPLGDELPEGWLTHGYPLHAKRPAHQEFFRRFQEKYGEMPDIAAFHAYTAVYAIAAALEKAGEPDRKKLAAAMSGLTFETPVGPVTFRKVDHQSTLGIWAGHTGFVNGEATLPDAQYIETKDFMPSDEEIRSMRKE
ncbi:MAG: ABC transporter substrate-binding protein [Alphaproteobacteria bacterium]|nr:ABC transporter substrate-binding protein [Alphaproteobacteria bacterium]